MSIINKIQEMTGLKKEIRNEQLEGMKSKLLNLEKQESDILEKQLKLETQLKNIREKKKNLKESIERFGTKPKKPKGKKESNKETKVKAKGHAR